MNTERTKEGAASFLTHMKEYEKLCCERSQVHALKWEALKKLRSILTPREYKILKLRHRENQTLEQVAKFFDVTRERIRDLECKALEKITSLLK